MTENPLLIRPFLQVASICERHILEPDGTLTLFRIFDRFMISGPAEEMPATALSFTFILKLASGPVRGKLAVKLTPLDISLQPMQSVTIPALFEGDDERSAVLIGQMRMEVKDEGLYWITVEIEGTEYTRVPLRVVYQRSPTVLPG